MSGLAISEAPRPSVPLRFLVAATLWGAFAGLWIAGQGGDAMASRWAPAAVALVHVLVLGVIGNAILGALTQFLPVAARSRLVCARLVPLLHAGFNGGVALFVFAMSRVQAHVMPWAAGLLGGSLFVFAAIVVASLWRGRGARWLRGGIGFSVGALAVTAAIGVTALLALAGRLTVALDGWIDVHAATGLIGAVLGLIAVIGSVTLPMLQGTRTPSPVWLRAWLAVVSIGLGAGAWLRQDGHAGVLVLTALFAAWALALASLWLQWRARHRRNQTLVAFWSVGVSAVAVAATFLVWPLPAQVDRAMLVGTLAIAIGLPLVVAGMMLEIVSFLAWIHLRGVVPRGRQIPGVGRLLPERDKRIALATHLLASAWLLAALLLRRGYAPAGVALALSWLVTLAMLVRCGLRVRREAVST